MSDNNLTKECWCSVPVHAGAKIAAWITIVCAVFMALVRFPYSVLPACLNILMAGLMLYGINSKRPGYYMPYLIWTVFSYIIQIVVSSIQLTTVEARPDLRQYSFAIIIVSLLVFFAIIVPIIYLFIVVPYYSYKLMKHEVEPVSSDDPPPYSKGDYKMADQNPV
ncbi:hypothetical protein M3Y97_01076700 [Aphelenchoides bicaudatus]|nr:hypothetical protein M3Y97_01076700 [Aphelenchoides bicaudatus]